MSTCHGSWRNEECPKYSEYRKNERDSDSPIRQKCELVKLKQLPVDEQNPKIDSQKKYIHSLKEKIAELEEKKRQLQLMKLDIDLQAGYIDSLQKKPSGSNDPRKEDWSFPIKKERDPDSLIHQKDQDEEIKNMRKKINSQADEIVSLKKRIAELEKEVEQLKGDRNILLIGQVCRNFQANLYQIVFPEDDISPYYSYKMAALEQDIKNIRSDQEKAKARKLWEQLKQREHPEKFQNLVKQLQKLRNDMAHPEMTDLDVKDVLKAAEEVNKQGGFGFLKLKGFNFEDVKDFIKMCGRIERDVKDSRK